MSGPVRRLPIVSTLLAVASGRDSNLADWIGLGIGFATAVASALAAWAAWRAANASEQTGREARDALVAALEPALVLALPMHPEAHGDTPNLWLRTTNLDQLAPAADLEAKVQFGDGAHVTLRRDVLRPFAGGDDWIALLREVTDEWPPAAGEKVSVRVQYSDVQGAGRHELTLDASVTPNGVDGDAEPNTTKRRIK